MKRMISDPLTLAIISMLCGMLLGAIGCILAIMISTDLHKDDAYEAPYYPTEEEMDQMYLWYEAEYGQKGAHEK